MSGLSLLVCRESTVERSRVDLLVCTEDPTTGHRVYHGRLRW